MADETGRYIPNGDGPVAPPTTISHIILILHGIRTHAEWAESLKAVLEKTHGVWAVPLRYRYFDLVRFLLPIDRLRQGPRDFIEGQLQEIRLKPEFAKVEVSIFAHSFGSHVIAELLRLRGWIRLRRVVLAGSVVRHTFPWDDLSGECGEILNECGWRDIFPVLAESCTWGYGATGTLGFGVIRVVDRFHEARHSSLLRDPAAWERWRRFFDSGEIDGAAANRPSVPRWISLLTVVHVKYLLPTLIILAGLTFYVLHF